MVVAVVRVSAVAASCGVDVNRVGRGVLQVPGEGFDGIPANVPDREQEKSVSLRQVATGWEYDLVSGKAAAVLAEERCPANSLVLSWRGRSLEGCSFLSVWRQDTGVFRVKLSDAGQECKGWIVSGK